MRRLPFLLLPLLFTAGVLRAGDAALRINSPQENEEVTAPFLLHTDLTGAADGDVLEATVYWADDSVAQRLLAPPFTFRLRPPAAARPGRPLALRVVFTLRDGRKLAAARTVILTRNDETLVRRILVPLSASANGKPLTDLTAADFSVTQDGAAAPIREFLQDTRPVNLLIAIDTSGSMELGHRLDKAKEAAQLFFAQLKPEDRIGLFDFNDEVYRLVPLAPPSAEFPLAVKSLEPLGATSLWETLDLALPELADAGERKAVVLITDADERGVDTTRVNAEKVGEAWRSSDAVLYAVFTASSGGGAGAFVAKLADASGGTALRDVDPKEIPAAAQSLVTQLRTQYLLSFTPRGEPDGKYHTISVTCRREGAILHFRRGFLYGKKAEAEKKKGK
jgi:VWFA-related protein